MAKIDGLDKALDVLDQRMSKKFKDYSDRCLAIAQLARTQAKTIADLTAEQENQKRSYASLHQEVSALSESVNAQILSTALQVTSSTQDTHEKENRELKARVSELQKELERMSEENKLLKTSLAMNSADDHEKEIADLKSLVEKLQNENEKITQEKNLLELSFYSNDHSEEIANLNDQIKKLEKELKETKSQKEFLELSASLKNDAVSDTPSERASIGDLSELLGATESDDSKGGFDVEFSEEDYFYREKNMKAITRAEKLLFLVGGTPSSPSTPDPSYEASRFSKDKKLRSKSPSIIKKKK